MKLVNCHHIRKRRRRRRRCSWPAGGRQQSRTRTRTRKRNNIESTAKQSARSINRQCYSANLLKTIVNNHNYQDDNNNNNSVNNYVQVRTDTQLKVSCDPKPISGCSQAAQVGHIERQRRAFNGARGDDDAMRSTKVQRVSELAKMPPIRSTGGRVRSLASNNNTNKGARFKFNLKLFYLTTMCLVTLNDNVDFVVDKLDALTSFSSSSLSLFGQGSDHCNWFKQPISATTTTSQSNCSNDKLTNKKAQDESCTTMTRCGNEKQRGQLRKFRGFSVQFASADSDANRLYEDLMMTYNRIVRPVQNESDRVVVRIGLKLSQLMEVVS